MTLTDTESSQNMATVNAVQMENGYYLVCEYYTQYVLGDGGYGATWVLEYQNETLQYVCSLENDDFGGSGSSAFAENCICLTGFYGPDFYAVSYDGKTICEINTFGTEYYWASNVTIEGNTALVYLNDGSYEAHIDLTTWDYMIKDVG